MVFGSKVYSHAVPVQKKESQDLSTDLSRAYFHPAGLPVDVRTKRNRAKFEQAGLHKLKGCVRIHFLLPHVRGDVQPPLCVVEDHDVVINITSSSFHLLFPDDPKFVSLIASITQTKIDAWGPNRQVKGSSSKLAKAKLEGPGTDLETKAESGLETEAQWRGDLRRPNESSPRALSPN